MPNEQELSKNINNSKKYGNANLDRHNGITSIMFNTTAWRRTTLNLFECRIKILDASPLNNGQLIACLLYKTILFSLQIFISSNNYLSGAYMKLLPIRACPWPAKTIDRKIMHPFLPRIQFHWTNGVTRRSVGISVHVQLTLNCHGLKRFLIYVINNLIKMLYLMHKCLLIYLFIYLIN